MKIAIAKLIRALREAFPTILPAEGFAEFDIAKEHLNRLDDAKQKLIDPTILINQEAETELFTQHNFVDVKNSPYPANAVKALWNIAVRVKRIVDKGIVSEVMSCWSHQEFVEANFNYLDHVKTSDSSGVVKITNTFLLKIVDDTTLNLAKIYLTFIDDVRKDPKALDFLPIIPNIPFISAPINDAIKYAKENCNKICHALYTKLSQAIKQYESRKQGKSTLNSDEAVDRMVDKTIQAITSCGEYFPKEEELINYEAFPLSALLANIKNIGYANDIATIEYEMQKLQSPDMANHEYMYIPRLTQNSEMEIKFLTTVEYTNDMIFVSIDQSTETIRNLKSYLDVLTSFADQVTNLEKRLPAFLAYILKTKITFYETTIAMVDTLQNSNREQLSNDENINTIFKKLTFAEDLNALQNFLSEMTESKENIAIIIVQCLAEPYKRLTALAVRAIDADKLIKAHLKEHIAKEISTVLNDIPSNQAVSLAGDNTQDEEIIIRNILQLKTITEKLQHCLHLLKEKYDGSPTEYFQALQDYILYLENDIHLALQALMQLVEDKYILKSLPYNKIEITEQKLEVIKNIALLEAANQHILPIARFVDREFSDNQQLKMKIQQALEINSAQIEKYQKMLQAFGDAYHLNQQLQTLQKNIIVLGQSENELSQQLERDQKRLIDLAQKADIFIQINTLEARIAKRHRVLANMPERRPTIDSNAKRSIEEQITALQTNLANRRTIPAAVGLFVRSLLPTFNEKELQEITAHEQQINDLGAQLENLNRPLKLFQAACDSLENQIRELDSQRTVLIQEASQLPAAKEAFAQYQSCKTNIERLSSNIIKNKNAIVELNSTIIQMRQDIITQTKLFNNMLTDVSEKLLVILKQLGIPAISKEEINTLRKNFAELLSTINLENKDNILVSIQANPDTQSGYIPLRDLIAEIEMRILYINQCITIHDTLPKFAQMKLEIYEKYFSKNPARAELTKPSEPSKKSPFSKTLHTVKSDMHQFFSSKSSSPAIPVVTRAMYFDRLERLYKIYMETGESEELRNELYSGYRNLPFNDVNNSENAKAAFQRFMGRLLEEIAKVDSELQTHYSQLASMTGSNLPATNYHQAPAMPVTNPPTAPIYKSS